MKSVLNSLIQGVLEWSELPGLELVMLDRWDISKMPSFPFLENQD